MNYRKILNTTNPQRQKKLGKKAVRHYLKRQGVLAQRAKRM